MLHTHTKKVRTYGKSNTRIISNTTHFQSILSSKSLPTSAATSNNDNQPETGDDDKDEDEDEADITPISPPSSPRKAEKVKPLRRGPVLGLKRSGENNHAPNLCSTTTQGEKKSEEKEKETPALQKGGKATRPSKPPSQQSIDPAPQPPIARPKPARKTTANLNLRSEAPLSSTSSSSVESFVSARGDDTSGEGEGEGEGYVTAWEGQEHLKRKEVGRTRRTRTVRGKEEAVKEVIHDSTAEEGEERSVPIDDTNHKEDDDDEDSRLHSPSITDPPSTSEPQVRPKVGTRKIKLTSARGSGSGSGRSEGAGRRGARARGRGRRVVLSESEDEEVEVIEEVEVAAVVEERKVIRTRGKAAGKGRKSQLQEMNAQIPDESPPEPEIEPEITPHPEVPVEDSLTAALRTLHIAPTPTPTSPLTSLLSLCAHPFPLPFDSFLITHEFFPSSPSTSTSKGNGKGKMQNVFRKVGEASYSEVFAVWREGVTRGSGKSRRKGKGKAVPEGSLVLKVIPLVMEDVERKSGNKDVDEGENMGEEGEEEEGEEEEGEGVSFSAMRDVQREIEIGGLMSEMSGGFARFHGAYVVKGAYPERLLEEWDLFDEERGSESARPDELPEDQLYALIIMSNAGTDLEAFKFDKASGWVQAWAAVMQVARTLEMGERLGGFEHRDLHEGQVLINVHPDHTVTATIVDFGLSRVASPSGVFSTPIPEDVFEGVGEQWDVYRAIRDVVNEAGGDWSAHLPVTNLLWLHHLSRVLLHYTPTLKKPKSRGENEGCYRNMMDLEKYLGEALNRDMSKPNTRGGRRMPVNWVTQIGTVREFLEVAEGRGW